MISKINSSILSFIVSVMAFCFLSLNASTVLASNVYLFESDVEEIFDAEEEISESKKEISYLKINGGGAGIIPSFESYFLAESFQLIQKKAIQQSIIEPSSVPFFILFCCLKVDC